jgi:hypothetical protein
MDCKPRRPAFLTKKEVTGSRMARLLVTENRVK